MTSLKCCFQTIVRKDINLNVGETLRVDFQLRSGRSREKVEGSWQSHRGGNGNERHFPRGDEHAGRANSIWRSP